MQGDINGTTAVSPQDVSETPCGHVRQTNKPKRAFPFKQLEMNI